MIRLLAAFCVLTMMVQPVGATERSKQGFGLMLTNDLFGDGYDRWRTGSFESSWIFAPDWTGRPPARFGELVEIRVNGEIVGPADLVNPAPLDRRYGQTLSFGLHTHFRPASIDHALGLEAVVTGAQVGLDQVQEVVHDVLGGRDPSLAVQAAQVSNGVYANAAWEAGREVVLGRNSHIRPFVELRAGTETLARTGVDLTFGRYGQSGLLIRAPISGHRFSAVEDAPYKGFSFLLGADVAYVEDSIFLPSNGPVQLEEFRPRARAGMHWRSQGGTSLYYGFSWLGEEFNTQPDGQIVGSLQLRVKF